MDRDLKIKKVQKILHEYVTPDRKVKRQKLDIEENYVDAITVSNLIKKVMQPKPIIISEQLIHDINNALLEAKYSHEKLEILSTLLIELSIRQIRAHFNVSRRMASRAKKTSKS